MATAREVVQKAIKDWQKKNTEQDIRSRTLALLDKAKTDLIAQEAGARYSFGRWEAIHFPSETSKLIKAKVQQAALEWIETALVDLPNPTAALKQEFLSAYKRVYKEAIKNYLADLAREQAQRDAQQLLAQFLEESDIADLDMLLTRQRRKTQTPLWS